MAEFSTARDVYHAAEKVRDAGFKDWDVHSPFPIHGMDGAMGLKKSILSWCVFVGGTMGTLTAFLL
ncbi:MAG: quinol:electron acceptor oxidoreductase subunit ActD, partial [Verrucomicrobiota bacterium]|nr:quinol:electron acceptor oxidoreductase subunit ActD [Verrucomicrobiota bacterium]